MRVLQHIRSLSRNLFRRRYVERDLDAEVRGYAAPIEEEKCAKA